MDFSITFVLKPPLQRDKYDRIVFAFTRRVLGRVRGNRKYVVNISFMSL